ncbi:XRP2 protein [Aphelenchoides avenae]|nr:XRP2 protein [Aphelenchus avenae]
MKFLCCFQTAERDEQYRIADSSPQPQKYSWDVERPDPSHYTFANEESKTLVKRSGEVGGQQFIIENCYDCIVLVLDHIASVTIDDCKDCLIVLGPCKGSVFVRDSSNCTVYSACQQFRTRDSFLTVFLFCSTAPIVEESTVDFFPLTMSYNGLDEHMAACELSPFTNRWSEVHNFTPESSRFTTSAEPSPESVGREIHVKIDQAIGIEGLRLSNADSYFFVTLPKKQREHPEERVLILVKAFHNQPKAQLYAETTAIIRDILSNPTVQLLETRDLDLREGELDAILQQKTNGKLYGKLISIEVCGADARTTAESRTASLANVDVVVAEKAALYRTQLYRLAEIQHSI